MYMPKGKGGYKCLIAARDDLSGAAEGRPLVRATAEAIRDFFWECLFCRYGAIYEVTTDNGAEVKGAFELLMKRYRIPQTRISPYNSRANGVVERGHFSIREALVRTCQQNAKNPTTVKKSKLTETEIIADWPKHVPLVFFADRITTR